MMVTFNNVNTNTRVACKYLAEYLYKYYLEVGVISIDDASVSNVTKINRILSHKGIFTLDKLILSFK